MIFWTIFGLLSAAIAAGVLLLRGLILLCQMLAFWYYQHNAPKTFRDERRELHYPFEDPNGPGKEDGHK